MIWTCTIPGAPIGKGRPRATVAGGRARMYTPGKTAKWEAYAAATLTAEWWATQPMEPLRCPVSVTIVAVFPRPGRLECRHKRACGCTGAREVHVSRPDADNIAKAVCDALEKAGVLHNDSQAWSVHATKWTASASEQPHVVVTVQWSE